MTRLFVVVTRHSFCMELDSASAQLTTARLRIRIQPFLVIESGSDATWFVRHRPVYCNRLRIHSFSVAKVSPEPRIRFLGQNRILIPYFWSSNPDPTRLCLFVTDLFTVTCYAHTVSMRMLIFFVIESGSTFFRYRIQILFDKAQKNTSKFKAYKSQ